jgi:succinate dehydrogenase/fumarate reductase cytochrome b subunit
MRKINTIISVLLLGLFVFHAIAGGYQLIGIMPGGNALMEMLAWVMIALLAMHIVIGIIMTAETFRAIKRAKTHYLRQNIAFWIRRVSGFALMILAALHLILFVQTGEGIFRLSDFNMMQLTGQIIMVIALMLHLLCNIRPLAVALGLYGGRGYLADVLIVMSVVLLFCAFAFVVYYQRWNVLWR